jgi:hypothetical protein
LPTGYDYATAIGRTEHDAAMNKETGGFENLEGAKPLAIFREEHIARRISGANHSRFIMIRASTLLPAFTLALGLATAGIAMASQPSSNAMTAADPMVKAASNICAYSNLPDSQACTPVTRHGKHSSAEGHNADGHDKA